MLVDSRGNRTEQREYMGNYLAPYFPLQTCVYSGEAQWLQPAGRVRPGRHQLSHTSGEFTSAHNETESGRHVSANASNAGGPAKVEVRPIMSGARVDNGCSPEMPNEAQR
jgi:hypothetical protein